MAYGVQIDNFNLNTLIDSNATSQYQIASVASWPFAQGADEITVGDNEIILINYNGSNGAQILVSSNGSTWKNESSVNLSYARLVEVKSDSSQPANSDYGIVIYDSSGNTPMFKDSYIKSYDIVTNYPAGSLQGGGESSNQGSPDSLGTKSSTLYWSLPSPSRSVYSQGGSTFTIKYNQFKIGSSGEILYVNYIQLTTTGEGGFTSYTYLTNDSQIFTANIRN